MNKDSSAERRARKAERRAANIRKYARPNDSGAEHRAQKAERRADNIRNFAEQRSNEANSSDGDGTATFFAGCVAVVAVLVGVIWVFEKVAEWFRNLF